MKFMLQNFISSYLNRVYLGFEDHNITWVKMSDRPSRTVSKHVIQRKSLIGNKKIEITVKAVITVNQLRRISSIVQYLEHCAIDTKAEG